MTLRVKNVVSFHIISCRIIDLALVFTIFILIVGCTVGSANAGTIEATPLVSEIPKAVMVATNERVIPASVTKPTLTPTAIVCSETKGRIDDLEVPTKVLSYPLKVKVYFPPCYSEKPESPYPYVIMVHGMLYKNDQWDRLGVDEAADRLISTKESPPFMILMPFEEQSTGNPYEDGFGVALVDSMIPWMEENYPVCDERECRAIGGLSRGAGWAVHLGLSHSDTFGAIGAHSLPPFIGDLVSAPRWLAKIPQKDLPRVYIDIGIADSGMVPASQFEGILTAFNVPHEWHINNGEHTEDYWSSHVEEYLRWYASGWKEPESPVILR